MDILIIIFIGIGIFYIVGTIIEGIIYNRDKGNSISDNELKMYTFNKDLINEYDHATEPIIRYYDNTGLVFMIDDKTGDLYCIRKALVSNSIKQKNRAYDKSSEQLASEIFNSYDDYIQNNKPLIKNYIQKAKKDPNLDIQDVLTWDLSYDK